MIVGPLVSESLLAMPECLTATRTADAKRIGELPKHPRGNRGCGHAGLARLTSCLRMGKADYVTASGLVCENPSRFAGSYAWGRSAVN